MLLLPAYPLKHCTEQLWILNWKPSRSLEFSHFRFSYADPPEQNLALNAKRTQTTTEAVDVVLTKNENNFHLKMVLELIDPEALAQREHGRDFDREHRSILQV